jgi:toxin HigB-1
MQGLAFDEVYWRICSVIMRPFGNRGAFSFLTCNISDIGIYFSLMIRNFTSKTAQDIYDGENSRHSRKIPRDLHAKAQRLFDQLNVAVAVDTLKAPPGNRLERLKGDLAGFWSLRINDQWRIVFRWEDGDALDVDITDYH